ncbi:ATP-binding protein [Spiractinospora alimapuensis]|uniref:ATP-binding protein n=1 Tax=Spiractinospora alimapuensis TaxID=2820884 RepID=UPI001F2036DB|nr:ATP-binding protein [Spiractinospora alimapuensis]QVQ52155.1 ATP-binding protein [Spiractinospora alimapuensis]
MTTKRFAGLPGSVALARAWVRTELAKHGVDDDAIEEAVLVVSEFATNALLHTRSGDLGGTFTVTTEIQPTRALVSVTDQGNDTQSTPAWGRRPAPLAEHGHGLQLVVAMAETWTTITHHDHCTVTAHLPLLVPAQRSGGAW